MDGDVILKKWIVLQSDPKFNNFKWYNQLIFEANTKEEAKLQYQEFAETNNLPASDFVTIEEYENPYDKIDRLNKEGDGNGVRESD